MQIKITVRQHFTGYYKKQPKNNQKTSGGEDVENFIRIKKI